MKRLLLIGTVVALFALREVAECDAKTNTVLPSIFSLTDSCYSGVFVTQDDFIHDRLRYKINTDAKGNKMIFSFPADLTFKLEIVTPDTTFKFIPGSIYGYSECGKIYRYFLGGKEWNAHQDFYKIEEAEKGLIIYSSEFVSGNEIFYSLDLTSAIHRMTLQNLKNDFKNDSEFITAIKKLKKQPDGLYTRDDKGFTIMKLHKQ
jgi:hypothetical protein